MTNKLVETTYKSDDVSILLKDLSGTMEALDTAEREKMIQSGTHYSEMLPLEYKPTDKYMEIYEKSLDKMSEHTAKCMIVMCENMFNRHNRQPFVIISLARAGIPVGILARRYFKQVYHIDIPHYSISIIRGKGIDVNALNEIKRLESGNIPIERFQFLDGWTGKGAISRQLTEAVNKMKESDKSWVNLSDNLAVLADPANICDVCGTHHDFLIPSACLNSTVSGLISRTILRDDLINVGAGDFHGAVYFKDLINEDRSYEFIERVNKYYGIITPDEVTDLLIQSSNMGQNGMEVVEQLVKQYEIGDINLIKPGIGETTRVLLRRVPWLVLIDVSNPDGAEGIQQILRLCEEKNIPVKEQYLGGYAACGIIKDLSADA